jgi:hypothetical protein
MTGCWPTKWGLIPGFILLSFNANNFAGEKQTESWFEPTPRPLQAAREFGGG